MARSQIVACEGLGRSSVDVKLVQVHPTGLWSRMVQKLRREVEKTKRALSSTHQGRVEFYGNFDTSTLRRDQQRPFQEHPGAREAGHAGLGPQEGPG